MLNKNFYPTPERLAGLMVSRINDRPTRVLDPSAGKGDLLNAVRDLYSDYGSWVGCFAIEEDLTLQDTLRGKTGVTLLDSDFLTYSGPDKFDLIIMNPPFDNGDKHLLKAIEIMFRGQIICLLNAETLRNPYTRTRRKLVDKLNELDAEIEYREGEFLQAERPTAVDVALVNILIKNTVEDDLFAGAKDTSQACTKTAEGTREISKGKDIEESVADYNLTVEKCTALIIEYYRNYNRCGKFIGLNEEVTPYTSGDDDMTAMLQSTVNATVAKIRKHYWRKILTFKEVNKRLTQKKT